MAEILPAPSPILLKPSAPWHSIPQFLRIAQAEELRAAFDLHFSEPYSANDRHEVWNYWHVPESYTYLRTAPQKVFGDALASAFDQRMVKFARLTLGMDQVTWPFASLYVEGCRQTLHNDSHNGFFGYVYSLTRWDQRRFSGGETLVFREQDYWASGKFRESGAGTSFYELVPCEFNQLMMFDDRLIHGVPEVRGTTDPREGRLVLHGHIHCQGPFADGPLANQLPDLLQGALGNLIGSAQQDIEREKGRLNGFATLAVEIAAAGGVSAVRPLAVRVLSQEGPQHSLPVLSRLDGELRKLQLPAENTPSRIVIPILFK